jgi:hypothetical protein
MEKFQLLAFDILLFVFRKVLGGGALPSAVLRSAPTPCEEHALGTVQDQVV